MALALPAPRGYKPISNTFTSSDLIPPDPGPNRITIPTNGLQRAEPRILGGKRWGEYMSTYGGIGPLPFFGKTKVRDLDVARSHSHLNSGFTSYLNRDQPYRITPLRLSDGRFHDSIAPRVYDEYLDPQKLTLHDGIPFDPYFSHTSQNEVFPFRDQHRTNDKDEHCLGENTRKALDGVYTDLYGTTKNNKTHLDYWKSKSEPLLCSNQMSGTENNELNSHVERNLLSYLWRVSVASKGKPFNDAQLRNFLNDCAFNQRASSKELVSVVKGLCLSDTFMAGKMGVQLSKYPLVRLWNVIKSPESDEQKAVKLRAILAEFKSKCRQEEITAAYQLEEKDNRHLHEIDGRAPMWPPGEIYTHDPKYLVHRPFKDLRDTGRYGINQIIRDKGVTWGDLRSFGIENWPRRTPVMKYNARDKVPFREYVDRVPPNSECLDRPPKHCPPKPPARAFVGLQIPPREFSNRQPSRDYHDKAPYGDVFPSRNRVPPPYDYFDSFPSGEYSDNYNNPYGPLTRYHNLSPQFRYEKVKPYQITDDRYHSDSYGPPVPLSFCLYNAGDRIQDRLGLQYRSEGLQRYHAQHPESLPDLRTTRFEKRHKIEGYPAYVWHGDKFKV